MQRVATAEQAGGVVSKWGKKDLPTKGVSTPHWGKLLENVGSGGDHVGKHEKQASASVLGRNTVLVLQASAPHIGGCHGGWQIGRRWYSTSTLSLLSKAGTITQGHQ
jgi:hypothetical protein